MYSIKESITRKLYCLGSLHCLHCTGNCSCVSIFKSIVDVMLFPVTKNGRPSYQNKLKSLYVYIYVCVCVYVCVYIHVCIGNVSKCWALNKMLDFLCSIDWFLFSEKYSRASIIQTNCDQGSLVNLLFGVHENIIIKYCNWFRNDL